MNWVEVLLSSARKATSPASSILHSRMIMVCCLPEHVMEIRSLGFTSSLFLSHRMFWHSLSSSTQKMAVSFMKTAVFRGSFLIMFPLKKQNNDQQTAHIKVSGNSGPHRLQQDQPTAFTTSKHCRHYADFPK